MFILWDWISYMTKSGAYGERQPDAAMSIAHMDRVPNETINELRLGDLTFTQRLNSTLSWAMMYFTSSSVDHVALYDVDGMVVHVTLHGTRRHRLNTLAKGARVVAFRPWSDEGTPDDTFAPRDPGAFVRPGHAVNRFLAPKAQLLLVGVLIVLGLEPDRYRVKFSADLAIIALLLDCAQFPLSGAIVFFPLFLLSLLITVPNVARHRWRKRNGKKHPVISHPDIIYGICFSQGGELFSKLGPLVISKLGVLPRDVFHSLMEPTPLGGEDTDNSTDNKL